MGIASGPRGLMKGGGRGRDVFPNGRFDALDALFGQAVVTEPTPLGDSGKGRVVAVKMEGYITKHVSRHLLSFSLFS